VSVTVQVRVPPGTTGEGEATTPMETPEEAFTVEVAVAESLPGAGSDVAEETVAVLDRTVPPATAALTPTVSVKTALPAERVATEQETVPPAPTAGVVQIHPAADASETKVVPAGSVSESETDAASLGPAFDTVRV
jgi:hypothetical protein